MLGGGGGGNWESLLSHAWNSFLRMSPREMSSNVPGDEERL